jgi:hypoxanthine phosphoribosyltransferase
MSESDQAGTATLQHVRQDIERILIGRERIAERVTELAAQIRRDLALLDDAEIVLIPILTGSIIFLADLIRHLPQKVRISVITASSYAGRRTESTGDPILSGLPEDLHDKHVLIVDDILDSGTTIRRVRTEIERRRPKSLRACVLLRKRLESAMDVECEYVGFDIPNEFVVGYGLDYNGYYRNLPDIGVLKQDVL